MPVIWSTRTSTFSEVVNGLVAASGDGPTIPMGVIPLGTANDLTEGLGIPQGIDLAVRVLAQGQTRTIDVGRVNGRFFDNNSAIGLEPVITLENARLVRVKGTIRYLLAALICILRRPTWEMELAWDDGRYQGPVTLVSVGNGQRTGGFFLMTPEAQVDDGLLDFVFAPTMSRLKLLLLLPKTFSGAHVNDPGVTYTRTKRLTITCRPGTPVHADGEVFELDSTEISYDILPQKLTVIVPA